MAAFPFLPTTCKGVEILGQISQTSVVPSLVLLHVLFMAHTATASRITQQVVMKSLNMSPSTEI